MILDFASVFVPALVASIIRSRLEKFPDPPPLLDEYDYIVVGSGPGGSVVANRLSEDSDVTVLLLEAGTHDNETTQVPFLSLVLFKDGYDWKYETIQNQMGCLGAVDTRCPLPAGKVVGGSTALDMMIHLGSYPEHYNAWEKEGNPGWSYEELLPYFKKSEDYRINGECVEDKRHGCGGELKIRKINKDTEKEATEYLIQASKELGLEENSPEENGVGMGRNFFRIDEGIRQSAATAFLRPIMKRPNLHIYLESFVRKILIDPETKSVTGVEFEKEGVIKTVKAKREVILSAGTYSSPKILMLSGIGAKEELEKFNIPVIADLPGVGKNLKEMITLIIDANKGSDIQEDFITPKNIKDWKSGKGYFVSSIGLDAHARIRSKYAPEDTQVPDLCILLRGMGYQTSVAHYVKRAFGFDNQTFHDLFDGLVGKDLVGVHPLQLQPKSKGTVSLKSADPHDNPIVDGNYFAEEIDRKVQLEGIKFAIQLLNTSAIRDKGYKYSSQKIEQCNQFENPSDEYFDCFLNYASLMKWFGCCTNKMGPETNKMAVLDSRLRVYGVKGLRVVDASALPDQPGGLATNVFMTGEKAAAMIKEDNQSKE